MMRAASLALVALLLLAGCSAPDQAPTQTSPSSPPDATPGAPPPPAPTSVATPPPAVPTALAAGPASASGTPFDPIRWEEPRPIPLAKLAARVTGEWSVRVEGAAGAVPAGASVLVAELGTSRGAIVRAAGDGSFVADVVGAPGGTVRVAVLQGAPPTGPLQERTHQVSHVSPSTYLQLPNAQGASLSVSGSVFHGPAWRFDGELVEGASEIRLRGELRIRAAAVQPFGVRFELEPAFDEAGEPLPVYAYATPDRTPSGLPLERVTKLPNAARAETGCESTTCAIDLVVPRSALARGWNVALVRVLMAGGPDDADYLNGGARHVPPTDTPLGLVAHGTTATPRLAALLFADAPTQAQRGVQARADRWGWSNRIAFPSDTFVLPRTDATGAPIAHTLEPYLPQVLLADRDSPGLPLLRLDFPGGTWTVRVRGPDGDTTTLGPAPFAQLVSRTATSSEGGLANNGGGNVNALARPTTMGDAFRHRFAQDGAHTVEVEGELVDASGRRFRLAGTYDVLVAEPMDLDLGMLPGTPLEVGDYVDRAVQTHPPVPADITYRFRLWGGSDARLAMDHVSRGTASRFGWFHPHAGDPVVPREAGEYRVDVTARYTDADGRLWAASWSFGGVVVDPASALEVHGRRGIDNDAPTLARFARSESGIAVGGNHFNFPYYAGDVAWQTDDDSMEVRVSVADDPLLALPASLEHVDTRDTSAPDAAAWLAERRARGEVPLVSTPGHEAYAYATVERPGVRVREMVREDYLPNPYWRFDETYTLQLGVGPDGDAPNDYKFLFAGALVRAGGTLRTGGYSSLWVDIGEGESRTEDPFAPDAPPTLPGVRAFYDITGNRAGSTLVVGDVADFGGYVVPLGPHTVFVNVTSPSGRVRALTATANAWGHVHDPALNFEVDEAGVWRASVAVVACKAGRCLTGGLNDGSSGLVFYVADRDAAPLPVALPSWMPASGLRATTLGAVDGHATAWMPGWALDSRALAPGDPTLTYDVATFARLPNFERSGYRPSIPPEQVTLSAIARGPDDLWHAVAVDVWEGRVLAP